MGVEVELTINNNFVTEIANRQLITRINLAKSLFSQQAQLVSGIQQLANMAIDSLNSNAGIGSGYNVLYDGTNKLYNASIHASDYQPSLGRLPENVNVVPAWSVDNSYGMTISINNNKLRILRAGSGGPVNYYLNDTSCNYLSSNQIASMEVKVDITTAPGAISLVIYNGSYRWYCFIAGTTVKYKNQSDSDVTLGTVTGGIGSGQSNAVFKIEFSSAGGKCFFNGSQVGSTIATSSMPSSSTKAMAVYVDEWSSGDMYFQYIKATPNPIIYNTDGTLIWTALTSLSVPTFAYVVADETLNNGSITYYITRNSELISSISGIVGEYKFEDDAIDTSGSQNHGTTTAVTFGTGKIDKCSIYNGSTSQVLIHSASYKSLFAGKLAFSVAFWFKTSTLTGRMFSVSSSTSGGGYKGIELSLTAGGSLYVIREDSTYTNDTIGSGYADGNWHLVVLTADGTTNITVNIDNGATIKSKAYGSVSQTMLGVFVGRRDDAGQFFTGSLDSLRIYNKALSTQEIYTLYNEVISTYTTCIKNNLVDISSQPSGTSIKLKTVISGNASLNAVAWGWK
jgi:hypothetical protein